MRLLLLYPELPSCQDCQRWIYDPARGWQRTERGGQPVPRPDAAPPPCGVCPKIQRGARPHPSRAIELTDDNLRAYLHYQRCRAVGRFPADALVERNAGLLRLVEDQVDRAERQELLTNVLAAVQMSALAR